MTGPETGGEGGSRRPLVAIGARAYLVALLAAIGAAAGAVTAQLRPKTYRASASVLVGAPAALSDTWGASEMATFAPVARSRAVAERTALTLRLGSEGPMKDSPDPVRALQESISARPVGASRLLEIGCETSDPAWAAKIATAVAESFVAELADLARRQLAESQVNRTRIGDDLGARAPDDLYERLRSAEEELLRFQEENAIFPSEDPLAGLRQREAQLVEQLSQAQRERIAAEARLRQLPRAEAQARQTPGAKDPESGLVRLAAGEDAWVRQLVEERLRQSARVLELRTNFSDGHKDLESAKARLAQVERELASAAWAFAESQERVHEAALWKEREIGRLLDEHRARLAETRRKLARHDALRQRRDTLRALLAPPPAPGGADSRGRFAAVLVDRARPPAVHARPRRLEHVLVGLACGVAVGLGVAYLAGGRPTGTGLRRHTPAE